MTHVLQRDNYFIIFKANLIFWYIHMNIYICVFRYAYMYAYIHIHTHMYPYLCSGKILKYRSSLLHRNSCSSCPWSVLGPRKIANVTVHVVSQKRTMYSQQTHITYPQKSPIYPQKSSIHPQQSRTYLLKSPIYLPKSTTYPKCERLMSDCCPYMHQPCS